MSDKEDIFLTLLLKNVSGRVTRTKYHRFWDVKINHKAFEYFFTNIKRKFDLFTNDNINDGTVTAKDKVQLTVSAHGLVNDISEY